MLAIEGYSLEDVIQHEKAWTPLHFSKAKLKATIDRRKNGISFYTSDLCDLYPRSHYLIEVELVEK